MSERTRKAAAVAPSSLPVSSAGETPEAEESLSLKSESIGAGLNDRWLDAMICVFLAVIVWAVFGQTLRYEFVNYDDNLNVYENPAVKSGLTLKNILRVFQFSHSDYWHPLTMMSHMLDCQFYGLWPGGHHLTNVLLHATVAMLLFLVLRRMTGFLWRSAFVAAVFAIHPLRVESVAWVSERKDMLHGVFFLLAIGAYMRYVRQSWSLARYLAVVILFTLGLMSKPTLMPLPFVLLLLDYWPLGRFAKFAGGPEWFGVPRRLLLEKIPLLALAAASGVEAAIGNAPGFEPSKTLPRMLQLSNAMVSYVAYIWQMVYPGRLALPYPFPMGGLPSGEVIGAVILLIVISTVLFRLRQKHPCWLVGWLWYLGMLVPMIGFMQAGMMARADRYTYLPQIGLYLLLTWGAAELCANWRHRRMVLGGCATVILAALIFCSRTQASYWRNNESLWTHTLACTSDNFVAHNNLGDALLRKGQVNEAIAHFQAALQINPNFVAAHNNLGNALFQQGEVDEAIVHFQTALQIKPDTAEIHNNLGNALLQKDSVDEAMVHFQTALQIKPNFAEAHYNLGIALIKKRSMDEAIIHLQTALQINPSFAEARNNLGLALFRKGAVNEAIVQYQTALQIKPDIANAQNNINYALRLKEKADEAMACCQKALQTQIDSPAALNNLAWLLATCPDARLRDGVQAIRYAERACELTHFGATALVGTLAAAYAEAGRFEEAVATAEKACALATAAGDQELLKKNQELLELYRVHQPYHEAAEKYVPIAR